MKQHSFLCGLSCPQYFADVTEANSWLGDRKPLLTSEDHGKDESSTAAMLQRHLRLEKEMAAYASEIKRLAEQARSAAQLAPLTVSTGFWIGASQGHHSSDFPQNMDCIVC